MTIIKQKKQRVAIFIDAQNLYHSARSLYRTNVNFKNILEDTLADRELVRAIAYLITTETGEEKNFFDALEKLGIETKSKDLQVFLGGAKKGDWDVGMAVDAIRLSSSVDAVVLISGDGDFIPLVEYLKFNSGCQVEVATFRETASSGLIDIADDFMDLSENWERYLIKKWGMRFGPKKPNNKKVVKKESLKKNEIDSQNMEIETPEMVVERTLAKRGSPIFKKKEKINLKKKEVDINKKDVPVLKNTIPVAVEIKRVDKKDFILKEKKKVLKKKIVSKLKKELKVVEKKAPKKNNKTKIGDNVKKNKVVKNKVSRSKTAK